MKSHSISWYVENHGGIFYPGVSYYLNNTRDFWLLWNSI